MDECVNEQAWCLTTEDGEETRACDLHVRDALQKIVDEYGDGAPVFVWVVTE